MICQHLMPFVDKNPSIEVSVCISKKNSEYNFTPSYRKTWIASYKAIEHVYGNWENSYKRTSTLLVST